MITLLRLSCLYLYNRVRCVCFTTNLSLLSKKKTLHQHNFSLIFLSLLTLGLLVELENKQILLFVVLMNPNAGTLMNSFLKFSKILSRSIFTTLSLYMFSIAITPLTFILSLFVFQIFSFKRSVPYWVRMLLIWMSTDIRLNPGPIPNLRNNCLNFMNWNLNSSLTKDNFHRVDLVEAHNSSFKYDLISVCQTNLDDSVELPETLLNDCTFVSC